MFHKDPTTLNFNRISYLTHPITTKRLAKNTSNSPTYLETGTEEILGTCLNSILCTLHQDLMANSILCTLHLVQTVSSTLQQVQMVAWRRLSIRCIHLQQVSTEACNILCKTTKLILVNMASLDKCLNSTTDF